MRPISTEEASEIAKRLGTLDESAPPPIAGLKLEHIDEEFTLVNIHANVAGLRALSASLLGVAVDLEQTGNTEAYIWEDWAEPMTWTTEEVHFSEVHLLTDDGSTVEAKPKKIKAWISSAIFTLILAFVLIAFLWGVVEMVKTARAFLVQ